MTDLFLELDFRGRKKLNVAKAVRILASTLQQFLTRLRAAKKSFDANADHRIDPTLLAMSFDDMYERMFDGDSDRDEDDQDHQNDPNVEDEEQDEVCVI